MIVGGKCCFLQGNTDGFDQEIKKILNSDKSLSQPLFYTTTSFFMFAVMKYEGIYRGEAPVISAALHLDNGQVREGIPL